MAKLTLSNIANLQNENSVVATINANYAAIAAAMEKTLSRDGTSPNRMDVPLDMNGKQIINLPNPVTPNSPVRLQDLSTIIGGGTISSIPSGGTTGQVLTKLSNVDYNTGWSNSVTSVGLSLPADFTLSNTPVTTTGTLTAVWAVTPTGTGAVVRSNAPTLINATLTTPAISSPTGLVKGDVGLGNVDNTSDVNKPVSTATSNALALKADLASPALTDIPTAPTAAPGTNTNQIATNAFVLANAASAGVGTYNGLTGSVAAFTGQGIWVSPNGNNANNGRSPESAKQTIQAGIDAAAPGGRVYLSNDTFPVSQAINMRPGVIVEGQYNTVITQANGAGLSNLVEFSMNVASGAGFIGVTIDGNRANNTDNVNHIMVNAGTATDVVFHRCTFKNGTGTLLELKDSFRSRVTDCTFINFYVIGLGINPTNAQTANTAFIYGNRWTGVMGQHCFYTKWSDRNSIINNKFDCSQWIGVVNTNGTTVNYVSGTNFTGLTPGNFITINGVEYLITLVNSSTQLTINSTAGTQSSKVYVAGTGDIISVGNSSYNLIQGNDINSGGAGGIVIHQFYGGQVAQGNTCVANTVRNSAQAPIAVVAAAINGSSQIVATQVTGNFVQDGGRGAGAIAASVNCGITVQDGGTALNVLTTVSNNFVRDTTATTAYGINCAGLANGFTFMGGNTMYNSINFGLGGSFGPISFSSGWGTSPAVSDAINFGEKFYFRVTPGTGTSANPTITIPFGVVGLGNPRLYRLKAYDNNGTAINIINDLPPNTSGSLTVTCLFTPTPGLAVIIQGSC